MNWKKRSYLLNSRDRITRLKTALEVEVSKRSPSFELMKSLKQELSDGSCINAAIPSQAGWVLRGKVWDI